MRPVPVSQGLYQDPLGDDGQWGRLWLSLGCSSQRGCGQGAAQPHSAQDAPREQPALMCVVPTGDPCARDSGHISVWPPA